MAQNETCAQLQQKTMCGPSDEFLTVLAIEKNSTMLLYKWMICPVLRDRLAKFEIRLCHSNGQYLTACPFNATCNATVLACTNSTAKIELHMICPLSLPRESTILPAIIIPISWAFATVSSILVIWRRKTFPLKAKNVRALVLQYICLAMTVSCLALQLFLPCIVFVIGFCVILPVTLSFLLSRVCLLFFITL